MLEYAVAIARIYGQFPTEIVFYIGRDPLRMSDTLEWPGGFARYTIVDMREIDGEVLLNSSEVSDNVVGILARVADRRIAIRRILQRISDLSRDEASFYFRALLILAGLRGIADVVREERENMPFTIDLITENEVLAPAYYRGLEEGRQEGRQEGEISLLRQLIQRRFGALPSWVEEKLSKSNTEDIEALAVRVLDAASLEELFRS